MHEFKEIIMARMIGVLGGMGPLASVDFFHKVVSLTPASNDQEHIPMIIYSVPQIPDRTPAILGTGESPFPGMLEGLRALERAGVDAIAIPCNTAHFWLESLRKEALDGLHFIHIVEETVKVLISEKVVGANIGLLATVGTLKSGIYEQGLKAQGFNYLIPDENEQADLVMGGIKAVKAGDVPKGASLLSKAAHKLKARGAKRIIMGCTEIPIALANAEDLKDILLDPTKILAEACIAYSKSKN